MGKAPILADLSNINVVFGEWVDASQVSKALKGTRQSNRELSC